MTQPTTPPATRPDLPDHRRGHGGPGAFAADTAVEAVGPGRYRAHLHERWQSLVGIHGGYSAAVTARAIQDAVGTPGRPLRSIAVQFVAPPTAGPAEVAVTVERAGRSVTATTARLVQGDRLLVLAHALSAPERPGMAYDEHVRPRGAEPPSGLGQFEPPGSVAHFRNVDLRLDPAVVPFGGGDEAWIGAWVAPLDGEAIDTAWLVAMCDILPPAVFSRTTGPVKAASLEYVVHLATGRPELPAGRHTYLSCRSPLSTEGFAVEDATLWGPDGRVLAVARQTRLAGA